MHAIHHTHARQAHSLHICDITHTHAAHSHHTHCALSRPYIYCMHACIYVPIASCPHRDCIACPPARAHQQWHGSERIVSAYMKVGEGIGERLLLHTYAYTYISDACTYNRRLRGVGSAAFSSLRFSTVSCLPSTVPCFSVEGQQCVERRSAVRRRSAVHGRRSAVRGRRSAVRGLRTCHAYSSLSTGPQASY